MVQTEDSTKQETADQVLSCVGSCGAEYFCLDVAKPAFKLVQCSSFGSDEFLIISSSLWINSESAPWALIEAESRIFVSHAKAASGLFKIQEALDVGSGSCVGGQELI